MLSKTECHTLCGWMGKAPALDAFPAPLFKSSRDGLTAQAFHNTCDGVSGGTLTIGWTNTGCVGGVAGAWSSFAALGYPKLTPQLASSVHPHRMRSHVVGGYASVPWTSCGNQKADMADDGAYLFRLKCANAPTSEKFNQSGHDPANAVSLPAFYAHSSQPP